MNKLDNIASWIVTVPFMKWHADVSRYNTNNKGEQNHYVKCKISLSDALKFLADKDKAYLLHDILSYNVTIRDVIREYGIGEVIGQMKNICYGDKKIIYELDWFESDYEDFPFGNFDIQLYREDEDISFFGYTLHGIKDLLNNAENSLGDWAGRKYFKKIPPEKAIPIHIGVVWTPIHNERYLDPWELVSHDNYIIRNHKITNKELKHLNSIHGDNKISEMLSDEMLPMVYNMPETPYMLVATAKNTTIA